MAILASHPPEQYSLLLIREELTHSHAESGSWIGGVLARTSQGHLVPGLIPYAGMLSRVTQGSVALRIASQRPKSRTSRVLRVIRTSFFTFELYEISPCGSRVRWTDDVVALHFARTLD
jgi:hypothetical protein